MIINTKSIEKWKDWFEGADLNTNKSILNDHI